MFKVNIEGYGFNSGDKSHYEFEEKKDAIKFYGDFLNHNPYYFWVNIEED